jgi:hypothetical protein
MSEVIGAPLGRGKYHQILARQQGHSGESQLRQICRAVRQEPTREIYSPAAPVVQLDPGRVLTIGNGVNGGLEPAKL